MSEDRIRLAPADPDERVERLTPLLLGCANLLPAEVPPANHDMTHSLRVTDREGDCDLSALREAEQRKPVDISSIDDRLEVGDPRLERKVLDLPVGEPCPALVVADDLVCLTELFQPGAPERALPVELEVREPVRRLDERRALPVHSISEAHPVVCSTEPDLLVQRLHRTMPAASHLGQLSRAAHCRNIPSGPSNPCQLPLSRQEAKTLHLQGFRMGGTGLEPVTPSLSSWCSPN